MKAQDLKNSVLQLAIQGKLVEQNKNDKPASILLEKIKAEKEKLIKEKKIKREKPLPEISEEEKPFEIPESWEWVRLGDVCDIINGFTPSRSNKLFWENGDIPWFTIEDIREQGRFIKKTRQNITKGALGKSTNRILPANTVLLCCTASVGEYAYTEIRLTTNQQFNGLVIRDEYKQFISSLYLFEFVKTLKSRLYDKAGTTTFSFLSVGKLREFIMPVPPVEEQKRIVSKIEEILEKIEEYDKIEKELSELEKAFPQDMKKSILQYAIQGKLVEQNPNDEPASVLLEKIKAEKEQLIKEKKIKREKVLPEISDEEKPFEIPENWEWVYISDIAFVTKLAGFEYTKYIAPNLLNEGIPLFKGKNVQNGRLVYEFESFISKEISDLLPRSKVNKRCLLTPYVGTIGNIAIFEGDMNCHLGSNVGKIELFNNFGTRILEEYLLYYLRSEFGYKQLTKHKKATAQESISIEAIRNCLIAIPPLEEQKRIVAKIEMLLNYVDKLKKKTTSSFLHAKKEKPSF